MTQAKANLMVAVSEAGVRLKLAGRANMANSLDFKAVVYPLRQQGHTRFVLDLTDCVAMDSTFLGVLAAFVQRLAQPPERPGRVVLVNANPRITDFLDNLGVLRLFNLVQSPGGVAGRFQPVPAGQADRAELARASLEAHRALMELEAANIPKFKDVTRFLEEDLKLLQETPEPAQPRRREG
jgi:anti-anti-sigma factor